MTEDQVYSLEELNEKLTEKERIFCHEYIIRWNGSDSARKAGYSKKTARGIASENLTKPHIQQYIAYIKDDIAREAGISKLALILELKKIAMSDISEIYLDWFKMADYNKLKESNPEILSCIQEINTKIQKVKIDDEDTSVDVEYVKIKMYDKRGAIQDLLKAMGWNEMEQEVSNDATILLEWGGAIDMSDYKDNLSGDSKS